MIKWKKKNERDKMMKAGAALTLVVMMLGGCVSQDSDTTGGAENNTNVQEDIVTLKWYMSLNPIAADTKNVIEK